MEIQLYKALLEAGVKEDTASNLVDSFEREITQRLRDTPPTWQPRRTWLRPRRKSSCGMVEQSSRRPAWRWLSPRCFIEFAECPECKERGLIEPALLPTGTRPQRRSPGSPGFVVFGEDSRFT